jgi:predicted ATP-grasp superfamily ATP-dependent carboligase
MSVLVTDASGNHALSVIRSLGRKGLRVAAADSMRFAQGFFSRYCAEAAVYPSPTRGLPAFHAGLCRILKRLRPAVLMPMTERTILAIMAHREEIESYTTLAPLPSREALGVAFDKKKTIELAVSLGVAVPGTFSVSHLQELESIRPRIAYPAVIKPRRSEFRTADDRILPGGPVEYCFGPEALEERYLSVHRRAPFPLIQEFIPGKGYGISVLCHHGKVKALFAHRRLRMIRPTGSGSSLRESIPPPADMVGAARSLLEALRWHGVAMVEFKRDARDGSLRLMEINGRFWNSLPLAVAAGVDFPHLLHTLCTEGEVPDCLEYRVGVRGRWIVGDFRHLVEVFRGRPAGWTDGFPSRRKTLSDFMKFWDGDVIYDDLWFSDPVPFLAETADLFFRQLPRYLFQGRSGF